MFSKSYLFICLYQYSTVSICWEHNYRYTTTNSTAFRSNNDVHRPVILALELLKRYSTSNQRYYALGEDLFVDGVLKNDWKDLIVEVESSGQERINRVNYEICVLQALRDKLRSKEIWVVGAKRYCLT